MKNPAAGVIVAFLIAVSISGCGGAYKNGNVRSGTNSPENVNAARTNVEELSLLVTVPYETEDVVWKEYTAQKKVIAVLRFSPADTRRIVSEAEKLGTALSVNIPVETWFPSELIAQSEMSGDSSLKGLAYAANIFYQVPYTAGRITRIESSDYFVLELSAA